jgi:hypothetical protein
MIIAINYSKVRDCALVTFGLYGSEAARNADVANFVERKTEKITGVDELLLPEGSDGSKLYDVEKAMAYAKVKEQSTYFNDAIDV